MVARLNKRLKYLLFISFEVHNPSSVSLCRSLYLSHFLSVSFLILSLSIIHPSLSYIDTIQIYICTPTYGIRRFPPPPPAFLPPPRSSSHPVISHPCHYPPGPPPGSYTPLRIQESTLLKGELSPNIWTFLKVLQKRSRPSMKYRSRRWWLASKHPPQRRQYRESGQRILRIVEDFENRTAMEYLRGISHNLSFWTRTVVIVP